MARLAGLPPIVLAHARDVLARLERYELEVFAEDEAVGAREPVAQAAAAAASAALERAATRAGRRKAAAQASLFDLINQKVVDELREIDPETVSPEESKELLRKLREQII